MRFIVGAHRPLWLDEAQTGQLAMQPNWIEFARQTTYDINAPLYSILARLWAGVSGVSDPALRFLPAVLGVAAPLIALWSLAKLDRASRYTWCTLIACWIPGLFFSQEARCYTLVLALAVANTVAFIAVLRTPTRRAIWGWAGISSLLMLAHYFGFVICGLQGLTLLAFHRWRIVKAWPAAIAFLPPAAALASHVHGLAQFAAQASAGHARTRLVDVLFDVAFVSGNLTVFLVWLMWGGTALAIGIGAKTAPPAPAAEPWPAVAAWVSVAATVVAEVAAFFVPGIIDRYLTAFVPGLLLGLALIASRMVRISPLAGVLLISWVFTAAVSWAITPPPLIKGKPRDIHSYNYESASAALMLTRPSRLVFLWDTPLRPDTRALSALGGFFFTRAGRPLPVDPVVLRPGDDPNHVLIDRASAPGSAILWISDALELGTASIRYPPAIGRLDPAWLCRNFGDRHYRIFACSRDVATRAAFASAPALR